MLYLVLKRMIERVHLSGLAEKIDIFYATGKLTETEYNSLMELLNG